MTGPLAKADALLLAAARAALSAPKAIAGAQDDALPVSRSPRVDNEILPPSRLGLQQQAGAHAQAALPGAGMQGGTGGAALSAAARAILALAPGLPAVQADPVRGSGALWPAGLRAPDAVVLASALSGQVSESGLFYESHLAEFAGARRSLAQMQREPQAGLASDSP
ncbi:MAG: hypothetical protein JSS56_28595, partial [Proteobacteria bacterium]|nr:hypothetical protein [Pseudomonadota bacterium]